MRNWHATFISTDHPSGTDDAAVYFRRDFEAADGLVRATLNITALGIVEPYLNGVRVGDEVLAPGWTSYRHHLYVSTYDVTDLIAAGSNAIGAIVGEGWAVGALTWDHNCHNYSDLLSSLTSNSNTPTEWNTSALTRTSELERAPCALNGIYDGEAYDARLEPEGWNRPGTTSPNDQSGGTRCLKDLTLPCPPICSGRSPPWGTATP